MAMFPVVEVSGSAFERGRVHGEQARERVARSLANYARLFGYYGMPWDEAQRRSLPYRDVIGGFDAGLLEEMEGIARGAGRPFSEILALNARTEVLPPSFLTGADAGECTAIAVTPAGSATGGTLLAQNWDWVGAQREAMIVLRIPESDAPACLTLTEAGMLAKIGLNAGGVGVCLNILRSIFDGTQAGVPVHVLLRALLKRKSVRDAVEFCSTLAFGGSSNILMADRGGEAASLEFSPRGCAWCGARARRSAIPTTSSIRRRPAGRRRSCPTCRPKRASSARCGMPPRARGTGSRTCSACCATTRRTCCPSAAGRTRRCRPKRASRRWPR